jgi:protein-S-isoprenylcysteine O-methyltransferase Ste14
MLFPDNVAGIFEPRCRMEKAGNKKVLTVLKAVAGVALYAGLTFGSAGTLKWIEAWIFLGSFVFFLALVIGWLRRHDPMLLEERQSSGRRGNVKRWDRMILGIYTLFLVAMMVVAGLDAKRFGWSHVSWFLEAAGFLGLVPPSLLIFRVTRENTFLSERVRIQLERGHRVCTTGPYRLIRHPMYLGIMGLFLFIPLAFGSLYAYIPAVGIIALFILRTALEDGVLHRELPGYREYAEKVRFRLIPGIW